MNTELLLRVADHIEAFPDSFDLSWWAATSVEADRDENICDTVGCVAGWAAMIADPMLRVAVVKGEITGDNFCFNREATKHLELDSDQADTLFCSNLWWAWAMKVCGLEAREGMIADWDGRPWIALENVPAKAAAVILRELAEGRITLNGHWDG